MTLLEQWRSLLVPSGAFQTQGLWQLLVVIVLFAISSKTLGAKANAVAITRSSPTVWLKRNLCFLALWGAIVIALGICVFLKTDAPIFRFFSYLGGVCIVIGLLTSFIRAHLWASSISAVFYFFT